MYIVRMFAVSWLITAVVEELAAVIWKCRSAKELLTVLWINTVTNPCAVGLRLLSNQIFPGQRERTAFMIAVEAAVVLTEWRLFRRFLEKKRNYFLFSLTLNACSYGAGLLLPVIIRIF